MKGCEIDNSFKSVETVPFDLFLFEIQRGIVRKNNLANMRVKGSRSKIPKPVWRADNSGIFRFDCLTSPCAETDTSKD